MLSLYVMFWVMVGLFAVFGTVRGWAKEVVAASGLVLSLFAIDQLGFILLSTLGWIPEGMGAEGAARRQFYTFAIFHLVIAFFSYQGPRLGTIGARLRPRDSVQDKLLGMIVGGINGYLIAGTIWSFLEFQAANRSEWVRYAPGVAYPFDPVMLLRPEVGNRAWEFVSYMPIPLLAPYLLIILLIVFLFVIIVLI